MATLDVSFSLLIEAQGLIKVNLSDILDQFVSNQFMCPGARSFFYRLGLPLSLLCRWDLKSPFKEGWGVAC